MIMYFKILRDNFIDHGYKYKEGLNVDTNPFNPEPVYSGGLFFADENQICRCCNEGNKISEVNLLPGENVVLLYGQEYKAHQIVLGEIRDLWTVETFMWLKESGVNLHAANDLAFRMAAEHGHLDIIMYLEGMIKDTSVYDKALVHAAKNGHLSIIKHLIGLGAKIINEDALSYAASNGHLEVVKYLIEKGADIHGNHEEALKQAASEQHWNIVKYLIELGADLHISDEFVLKCAVLQENIKMMKWLINLGADIHIRKNYIISLAKANDSKNTLLCLEYLENPTIIKGLKLLLKSIRIQK